MSAPTSSNELNDYTVAAIAATDQIIFSDASDTNQIKRTSALNGQTPLLGNIDAVGFNLDNVGVFTSNATTPATDGTIRLGNNQNIAWRDPGNGRDSFLRLQPGGLFIMSNDANSNAIFFNMDTAQISTNATGLTIKGSGAASLVFDGTIEANATLNLTTNNLINAVVNSTVTGVSGITGLGVQAQDLDMSANTILNIERAEKNWVTVNNPASPYQLDFTQTEKFEIFTDKNLSFQSTLNGATDKKVLTITVEAGIGGPFNITPDSNWPNGTNASVAVISLATGEEMIAQFLPTGINETDLILLKWTKLT